MGTVSTPVSSSSPYAPVTFTGVSTYSSDLQSILTRQQAIDQIPVQALQNQESDISSRDSALSSLSSAVAAVGSALQVLGNLGSGQALGATSTDDSVVTPTATGATEPASYSITNVTSLASAASETSTQGYADGTTATVSSTGSLQLVVGSNTYSITLASGQNNLTGLENAINGLNAGVSASILTTGSGSTPDYLSVSDNNTGATTLKLIDDPTGSATNLLTSANQGTNTNFDLDGVSISQPTTTVSDVIPGVTLSFSGKTAASETVGVSVATDSSQIESALQNLATAYNGLSTAIQGQVGQSAGPLSGNDIVLQAEQALSSVVQYQGSGGSINNLANLGIEIDDTGQMSLNTTTFGALSSGDITSSLSFLGSSTTGLGGLQSAFTAITDPVSGTIATQENEDKTATQQITSQISTLNDQINQTETQLNSQLEAADALVADLQSQQSVLSSSIQALNYTTFGYQTINTA
jgi:flagellar hook-associated protein 2